MCSTTSSASTLLSRATIPSSTYDYYEYVCSTSHYYLRMHTHLLGYKQASIHRSALPMRYFVSASYLRYAHN